MAWLDDWSKRIKITIDKDQVDADLTNFPVPIYLSASSGQNNDNVSAVFDELLTVSGTKKIAITTSDEETQCYVEIERWDWINEKACLWTKIPTIASGTDTDFYLYYDSTQDDNTTYVGDVGSTPGQAVWDSNYINVYHFSQDPTGGAGCILDSTGRSNGTPNGAMTSTDLVTGQIENSKAIDFDGSDDYINIKSNQYNPTGDSELSYEVVAKVDEIEANTFFFMGEYQSAYGTLGLKVVTGGYIQPFVRLNSNSAATSTTGLQITQSQWHFIGGNYKNGEQVVAFLDSADEDIADGSGTVDSNIDYIYEIAGRSSVSQNYNITMSELRYSNLKRSTAWMKATYYSNFDNLLTYDVVSFTCSGTVQVNSVFTDGIDVRLYRRSTGEFIGETTTVSGGLFEINSGFEEDHYIVALYTTSGTNALIYDYIHT